MKCFRYVLPFIIVLICIPAAAADDMVLVPVEELSTVAFDGVEVPAPFFIDPCEVTNAEFAVFLAEVTPNTEEEWRTWINGEDPNFKIDINSDSFDVTEGFEAYPVVTVTLKGATLYAEWAGKSLPTSAQWEAAAMLGGAAAFVTAGDPEGAEEPQPDPAELGPHPVGSPPPDDLGLYDMLGNVWEWTTDEYETEFLSSMPTLGLSPAAGPTLVVVRGGGYLIGPDELIEYPAAAVSPAARFGNLGFRCVREAD
jgi:formylglycine-generating enzyme required for sulfatase activity